MKRSEAGDTATADLPAPAWPRTVASRDAEAAVGALYAETAVSLIRLAHVILGDRQGAEDVVQEAFCSLYGRWDRLSDVEGARLYVRASVVNGCRSQLRRRSVRSRKVLYELPAASAEAALLGSEERADLIRAVDLLPDRQREALVLRFYLELPDEEIAQAMGVRPTTVRSTIHRALEALGRTMRGAS